MTTERRDALAPAGRAVYRGPVDAAPESILGSLAHYFVITFVSLFPVMNPFSTVPLFLALTAGASEAERRGHAAAVSRNAFFVMVATLLLGGAVLEFMGISLAALRIAGGLVVAYLGFRMLFPPETPSPETAPRPVRKDDPTFIPLAFPSLTGAGTIAVILGLSTQIHEFPTVARKAAGYGVVLFVFLVLWGVTLAILRGSTRLNRLLGPHGLDAMTRIMGLLLICIGIEFIGSEKPPATNYEPPVCHAQADAASRRLPQRNIRHSTYGPPRRSG